MNKFLRLVFAAVVAIGLGQVSPALAFLQNPPPTVTGFLGCQPDGSTPCTPNQVAVGGTVFITFSGPVADLQNPRVGFGASASGVSATVSSTNELSFKVPTGVAPGSYPSITIATDNLPDIVFSSGVTVNQAGGNPPGPTPPNPPGPAGPNPPNPPGPNPPGPTPPQVVNSDLQSECGKQGLAYDASTGLCLPANPFNANANSLAKATSVGDLIKRILDILLTLAGVIAVLFIVIGGYSYITSRGNEKQAASGRQTLTYAIIGLAAVLLAYTLVNVLTNLFTQGKLFGQ